MFSNSTDNWGTIGAGAVMETLENRQFLSASPFESVAMSGPLPLHSDRQPAAIELSLSHGCEERAEAPGAKVGKKVRKIKKAGPVDKVKKVKKAKKTKAAKSGSTSSSEPTLAGKWSGVAIIDKGNVEVAMSAKLKQQSDDVASAKVKMSAVMGRKAIKSNLIMDPYNNCRMVLSGNGSIGGLTAAASPDGNSIVGRWTWNVNGLWVTGTFKLTKIA